jgi:glycine/D-amino acid oxidase-like deaminating enzyme
LYEVDVLIAGGGVAGMLVATKLCEQGFRCVLIEPSALAAEQSGHSHGYIHRGYIYLRAEDYLVRQLRSAREQWEEYISKPTQVVPCSKDSLIGFMNGEVAKYATQTWRAAELPLNEINESEWPSALKQTPLTAVYRTDEQSFDFTRVMLNLLARMKTCKLVHGSVVRLSIRKMECCSVEIQVQGNSHRVKARYVVLAAGRGTAEILSNTLGKFRSVPNVRTSYMLVLKGEALEPISAILPEHQFYGLFMVSRQDTQGAVWLVSNYLSYGGLCGDRDVAARTWTRATLKTLDKIFPMLKDANISCGIYVAPKAEFRRDPERLPEGKIAEKIGLQNVLAIWPTKLTLSPLIAIEVVEQIIKNLQVPTRSVIEPTWANDNELSIAQERWTSTLLRPRFEFEAHMGQ